MVSLARYRLDHTISSPVGSSNELYIFECWNLLLELESGFISSYKPSLYFNVIKIQLKNFDNRLFLHDYLNREIYQRGFEVLFES